MSATPPSTVQGTHAPSPIELAWERYKSIIYVVLLAAIGALAINYGVKKYSQGKIDAEWSQFATTLGLDAAYTDVAQAPQALSDRLDTIDAAKLEAALPTAPDAQKPFLLMALAKKAVLAKDWARAESALQELEAKYPNHSLVKATPHPVQAQEVVKEDPAAQTPPNKRKPPEWKPAVAGSAVSHVRTQIEAAKSFAPPPQFARHEVPADATKIKYELSGDYGSFTIALMPQTPLHRAKVLELAKLPEPFWKGLAIDHVRRPTKTLKQPHELHLGLESTRKEGAEWTDTEPSKHVVEFEKTNLSHFAGAVSARNEKDGKSCADRFWIVADDAPQYDGERVIFAYVVEGLENVKRVCETTLSSQEEEQGRGKPTEAIRVTNVTVLE
jgi:cyclophilin family peptidyl-prolyl cis-trans isomerase